VGTNRAKWVGEGARVNLFFQKAKAIEGDIDKFLENISLAAMTFELGVGEYYHGKIEPFEAHCADIRRLEHESDSLRRNIKITLYRELLIPDARGDVLGLIETLDNVIDNTQKVILHFLIEKPIVWEWLTEDFLELTATAVKAIQELVSASRSFFRDISHVDEHLSRVHYWEHEADTIELRIKKKTFAEDSPIDEFSRKVHMRYFAEKISLLADEAESVAERLEVYTIKRTV
jgi:predicted phosphate transport protein (TIGR00153 family)